MSKQTDGAVRAAEKIAESTEHCRSSMLGGFRAQRFPEADWIATTIDQETGLPEITAERDGLRKACEMALGFPTACTFDRKGTKWDHPANKPDQPEIIRTLRAALAKAEPPTTTNPKPESE